MKKTIIDVTSMLLFVFIVNWPSILVNKKMLTNIPENIE